MSELIDAKFDVIEAAIKRLGVTDPEQRKWLKNLANDELD